MISSTLLLGTVAIILIIYYEWDKKQTFNKLMDDIKKLQDEIRKL